MILRKVPYLIFVVLNNVELFFLKVINKVFKNALAFALIYLFIGLFFSILFICAWGKNDFCSFSDLLKYYFTKHAFDNFWYILIGHLAIAIMWPLLILMGIVNFFN